MEGKSKTLERLNTITNKEMEMLTTVMYKYNFKLVSAEKVRSEYKIVTDKGNFSLKRVKHGRNSAKNGCILAEELLSNNFTNTAKYLKTKEGTFPLSYKKNVFYLREWIEGSQYDLSNIDEAINCSKLLAQFHMASNKSDYNKAYIPNNLKNLPKIFDMDLNNLEKFKRIIHSKRLKNEFDMIFLENIDNFYNRGISAMNMLNKSDYYKASKDVKDRKLICHNKFCYDNIIKKDEEYFIIDFDSIVIDFQISDLGNFIIMSMSKKTCGWDFNFAKALIEAYNSIYKLNKEDLVIMLAMIVFPHKFCKIGKRRFIKQKKWSETKYLHKLNKIIAFNENQEKFYGDYLCFLEEFF